MIFRLPQSVLGMKTSEISYSKTNWERGSDVTRIFGSVVTRRLFDQL